MLRHYALSAYLRQRFGSRVRKAPLDAGFSCPNRDGSLSTGGCAFCNEKGSGTGMLDEGRTLADQWTVWRERMDPGGERGVKFLAYLQSYSNTYGPAARVRQVLAEAAALPGVVGLCVGTRPDCLDEEKVRILAEAPTQELWLDLGLQSAVDATLKRVNRGHTVADFARIVELCARFGVKVCAHLIAGLPGEGPAEFLHGVEFLSGLPVSGVKLHNLFVCKGTAIGRDWERGQFRPMERDVYVELIAESLTRLRPNVVIHRLASDPGDGELLAPDWADNKRSVLNDIAALMQRRDLWQGKSLDPYRGIPLWFDAGATTPATLTD